MAARADCTGQVGLAFAVNHHDPAAVEDAWRRILAFFAAHVGRPAR